MPSQKRHELSTRVWTTQKRLGALSMTSQKRPQKHRETGSECYWETLCLSLERHSFQHHRARAVRSPNIANCKGGTQLPSLPTFMGAMYAT